MTPITGIGSTNGRKTAQRWKRQPRSPSNSSTETSSASTTSTGTASSSRPL